MEHVLFVLAYQSTILKPVSETVTLPGNLTTMSAYKHKLRMAQGIASKAFTLIELLVVIAIISLIVSILLPSLQQAKALAKRTVCASNYHSMGVLMQMYLGDNGGFPRGDATDFRALHNWGDIYYGLGGLRDYVDDNSLENLADGDEFTKRGIFSCPDPNPESATVRGEDGWYNMASLMYIAVLQYDQNKYTGDEYTDLVQKPINPDIIESGAALLIDWWYGNPGCPWTEYITGSSSHGYAGTNILYVDGSADWMDSDTIGANASGAWPAHVMIRSAYNR